MSAGSATWQPKTVLRFEGAIKSSMRTARVVTDAGKAHLKAMGNPQGPHPLACEWVGTELARWLGLPTFDTAIMSVGPDDEIPFHDRGRAAPGPAIATRTVPGHAWGSSDDELATLVNPDDITRLVVFDTWTLNCDRHPPDITMRRPNRDNVFLSSEGLKDGQFRLIAMDFGNCFTCGRDLSPRMADLGKVQDDRFYGLFPAFRPLLRRPILNSCRAMLSNYPAAHIRSAVNFIPREWDVPRSALPVWEEFVNRRAAYMANAIISRLIKECGI